MLPGSKYEEMSSRESLGILRGRIVEIGRVSLSADNGRYGRDDRVTVTNPEDEQCGESGTVVSQRNTRNDVNIVEIDGTSGGLPFRDNELRDEK